MTCFSVLGNDGAEKHLDTQAPGFGSHRGLCGRGRANDVRELLKKQLLQAQSKTSLMRKTKGDTSKRQTDCSILVVTDYEGPNSVLADCSERQL